MTRTALNPDGSVKEAVQAHEIKHIQRVMSRNNAPNEGAEPAAQIEAYINSFLVDGWTLVDVMYLGDLPEGYNFLWVLYR